MGFKNYLKSKMKYLLGIASMAAIVSQLILPVLGTQASTPRFNFMAGDYELLKGANVSNSETVWKDPVSGVAGDEFRAQVYYHNGILESTAYNTTIRANIPSETINGTAHITASISADNAETVTNTVVDGQIIGPNGLTVNFPEDVDLEYIPGSTKWFPENTPVGGAATFFPFGQSGDEIVSGGVNIGDIEGCWEHAGFVIFGFRAVQKEITMPDLNIEKDVLNISNNEVSYHDHSAADLGDELKFRIIAKNGGNADLTNLVVSDDLPAGFSYVPGTMEMFVNGSSTGTVLSGADASAFFGDGLNVGTLSPISLGGEIVITYKSTVSIDEFTCKQLVNTAYASSTGLSDQDTAIVEICANSRIVKSKSAYNQTRGQVATIAGEGDVIEYKLITKNEGDLSVNYVVEDGIADVLEYADVISVSDNGVVVDGTDGNEAKMVRYPTAHIGVGETLIRTFTVQVKNPLPTNPQNGYSYDDRMYNIYGNEVIVKIIREKEETCLHIEKWVRNLSANEVSLVDLNKALARDVLEYRVNFSNSGNGNAIQVLLSDALPENVSYIPGTTKVAINGDSEYTTLDGVTVDGIVLDSIPAGASGYVTFQVVVSENVEDGDELINEAFLTDEGKTISDTAKTIVVKKIVEGKLPVTGSTACFTSFLITLLAGIGVVYLKYRRESQSMEAKVVNDLLS